MAPARGRRPAAPYASVRRHLPHRPDQAHIRGQRRERLLTAARAGADLTDLNTVPDAFDQRGPPVIHQARVIEYDVPDRVGNGTGELICGSRTAPVTPK